MSETAGDNGRRTKAVVAERLRKQYLLGEHQSLKRTLSRLAGRRDGVANQPLHALAGVDFSVPHGEAFGIVGTNGSGKSTVLQILAGTTLPTAGVLRVHGRILPLLAVGTGFHPELTGRENVTLFASSLRFPRAAAETRMESVAEFAELERHLDTPVKRYSSGMVSRLSFAIAMQFPADIYVFDEVLAVVDGEFQARCIEEIHRLHRAGRTVIFVSHDREQVAEVCDRVMWLEEGMVRDIGPSTDVLAAYERVHGPPGH